MKEKIISKKRDSNLELYRILVMFLIIAHHYVVNSGLMAVDGPIYSDVLSWRSIFLLLFGAWGKTGINCFVLITGYFMCKSDITMQKFVKLLGEVLFYKVIFWIIFVLTGYEVFSWKNFAKAVIPIYNIGTGFTQSYLMFFLLIPFLNILVRNMTKKQHSLLLCLLIFIYTFLGTVPFFEVTMNYVSWFSVLYILVSFIRMYPLPLYDKTRFWAGMSVVSIVVSGLSVVVCAWLSNKTGRNMAYYFVQDSNTFLALVTSVCTFMLFKNIKMPYSKVINAFGASTFGVLLIHANSDTMRRWLWNDVLDNVGHYNSPYLVAHAVISVIVIFIVAAVIDMCRAQYIEKNVFKIWNSIEGRRFNR